jgi:hypothetical protein
MLCDRAMPVVWLRDRDEFFGPRQLQAPKESSARGWWNEVRKTWREYALPPWGLCKGATRFEIMDGEDDRIAFRRPGFDVLIYRRRNMR